MLRKTVLTTAAILPLLATGVSAQEALVTTQGDDELRGEWVIGASINSPEGEAIGSIQDIILDEEDGSVTAAVVSVGGFLGIGAKSIAISWDELQMDWDASEIVVALTREEAEEAPEYEFRDREYKPAPAGDTGTGTGTDMGTGTGTGTVE